MSQERPKGLPQIYPRSEAPTLFAHEEARTTAALKSLKISPDAQPITADTPPSLIAGVGNIRMIPEYIPGLRIPYGVEILGMPRAGKTTMINRYFEELWERNERHLAAHMNEGARTIKDEYGDLRYTDPFSYNILAGSTTFMGYFEATNDRNQNARMIVADRGQIDRRVFRRHLFLNGYIKPSIMEDESQFIADLENSPIQTGGIIMFLNRPEVSLRRGNEGVVANPSTLHGLYEQYLRLHSEIRDSSVKYRLYSCIDAEQSPEEVYERFQYAMDQLLNIHSAFSYALAEAFPKEYDEIRRKTEGKKPPLSNAQIAIGKRVNVDPNSVQIIGGDEMEHPDDILNKPIIEGRDFRKKKWKRPR